MHAMIVPEQEMAAIISDSNNAYHARDKAQGEMMALRQQVLFLNFELNYDLRVGAGSTPTTDHVSGRSVQN